MKKVFELTEKIKKNCIRRQFITYFFVAVFAYIVDYIMFLLTMYLSSNLVKCLSITHKSMYYYGIFIRKRFSITKKTTEYNLK